MKTQWQVTATPVAEAQGQRWHRTAKGRLVTLTAPCSPPAGRSNC